MFTVQHVSPKHIRKDMREEDKMLILRKELNVHFQVHLQSLCESVKEIMEEAETEEKWDLDSLEVHLVEAEKMLKLAPYLRVLPPTARGIVCDAERTPDSDAELWRVFQEGQNEKFQERLLHWVSVLVLGIVPQAVDVHMVWRKSRGQGPVFCHVHVRDGVLHMKASKECSPTRASVSWGTSSPCATGGVVDADEGSDVPDCFADVIRHAWRNSFTLHPCSR